MVVHQELAKNFGSEILCLWEAFRGNEYAVSGTSKTKGLLFDAYRRVPERLVDFQLVILEVLLTPYTQYKIANFFGSEILSL